MTYPTTKTTRMDGDSVRVLTQIPDILAEHGIRVPKGVVAAVEKHTGVIENIKAIDAGTDPATAHVNAARALADGTGTVEQVTTAAASQLVAANNPQSPYRMILKRGRDLAAADLQTAFATLGDDWINILRPVIEKAAKVIVEETQYSPLYDAFMYPTAADHWSANPRVSEAWSTIRDLYQVARTLRRYKITPATERRDDWFEWTGDGEYNTEKAGDHLQASVRDNLRDGNLTWFLMAMQYGMTPTLLTESEAAANSK